MTHNDIRVAITQSFKNHEEVRLAVMRGLLTACTNELVTKGRKPSEALIDEEVLAIIRRGAKQRRESIDQFAKGGREDLVAREREELAILEALLPAEMPREEVEKFVKEKLAAMGADASPIKAGVIIGTLMKDLKGKANGAVVKEVVEGLLKG